MAYRWPDTVCELRNTIERAMILENKGFLDVEDLPVRITSPSGIPSPGNSPIHLADGGYPLESTAREMVRQALERAGGNQSTAARL